MPKNHQEVFKTNDVVLTVLHNGNDNNRNYNASKPSLAWVQPFKMIKTNISWAQVEKCFQLPI